MMRLLCDGVYLDLYDNAGLQFTHDNPLFAFDDLKCERTTQFKLPKTPTNDRVFSLARIPAFTGEGMRRKFTAQLQAGAVVKDGYLYVSNFDGKDYNAIFVCGELVGLQRIKDAGSVKNYLYYNSAIQWTSNPKDADASNFPFDVVKYLTTGNAIVRPSVRLTSLLEQVASKLGVTIDTTNVPNAYTYRHIKTGDILLDGAPVPLHNVPSASQDPVNLVSILGVSNYHSVTATYASGESYDDESSREWRLSSPQYTQFQQLKLPFDCTIAFPDDFPSTYFLVSGDLMPVSQGADQKYYFSSPSIQFLGGWSFYGYSDDLHTAGAPLAGRSVNIPANTPFMLITAAGYKYPTPTAAGQTAMVGFDADLVPAYNVVVNISSDYVFQLGDNVPYNALLPDKSAIDILKAFAGISGNMLNYDDTNGVTFEPLNYETYAEQYVDALTKKSDVTRTFGKYAQRNLVLFDSSDGVVITERISANYPIDNDNLEREKELQKIAFSEGGMRIATISTTGGTQVVERLLIREGDDSDTICRIRVSSADAYLERVALTKNAYLQNLCDASTQYKIEVRMNMLQYNMITAKTLIYIDGTRYIWTERSWQKNVAKFTLAKI